MEVKYNFRGSKLYFRGNVFYSRGNVCQSKLKRQNDVVDRVPEPYIPLLACAP